MQRAICLLVTAGCATSPAPAPSTPDYRPTKIEAAPRQSSLYVDCLGDAVANHRYGRSTNADTTLLVFTCQGETARAFFDGLAAWSAKIGSQFEQGGVTYRSSQRVRKDLFGVDYCSADTCVITLNVGDFVRGE